MLEDRRLLSVAPGLETEANEAIQLLSTATALFVENQGQWADATVRYGFNGDGVKIAFTDDGLSFYLSQREAVNQAVNEHDYLQYDFETELIDQFDDPDNYITHSTQFSVQFDGANTATPIGLDQAETYFNYFIGNPENWRSHVPGYEVVAYENLYDGIDLHTFGHRNSLKYEFYVAPGADYREIEVSYDGIDGLWIDDAGALHVTTELGELVDDAPYIYQTIGGQQTEVTGRFALVDADTYAFEITGAYDPNVELIIDPDLAWSTYLGGSSSDRGCGIAVDAAGAAYVTGVTESSDFPTTAGAFDTSHNGGGDAFVAKFTSDGALAWSTYLGGNDYDIGYGIAVDASGAAYVTGRTDSTDFPTTAGAYDTSYGLYPDAFVAKFASDGVLAWSTFLGGGGDDYGYGIVVGTDGAVYVAGRAGSSSFPTTRGAYDTSFNGNGDAFVAKFTCDGALVWSTFLGGGSGDSAEDITVDASGFTYVTGWTVSSDFPTTVEAYNTSYNGKSDAFVAKFTSGGSLVWSTFLGGSDNEHGYGIAVDASGFTYVTGWTVSSDFPTTVEAYNTSYNGDYDAFVAKFTYDGALIWSTYLGGNNKDTVYSIAVDAVGAVYVPGYTRSTDFPTTTGAYDTSYNGMSDAFLAKFTSDGALAWSTYFGGSSYDLLYGEGANIAVDAAGAVYVTGCTSSTDFPTTAGAYDTSFNGGNDTFVAKFTGLGGVEPIIDPDLTWSTYLGGIVVEWSNGIAVDVAGAVYITGETVSSNFPTTTGAYDTSYNGGFYDAFIAKFTSGGALAWSTYLGGGDSDEGYHIAVDTGGAVYVAGRTRSSDFSTTAGAYDTSYNGIGDAFLAKFTNDGTLAWSTYLGGGNNDYAKGIAVDAAGAVYIAGETGSTDFPTTAGAYDASLDGVWDAFVAKFTSDGALAWSTYLGGSSSDFGHGIAVDVVGDVYITGKTQSSNFPTTTGAFDTSYNGSTDTFVAKFTSGGALTWSTYLGGFNSDFGDGIAVDASGAVYVTGNTGSSFPTTVGAYDIIYNGGDCDAFVAKFTSGGALAWSTYLGGGDSDEGYHIAVDAAGAAYVVGWTFSTNFPTTAEAYDTSYNGDEDAFVTKFTSDGALAWSTYLGGSSSDWGYDIAVDAAGVAYVAGYTFSTDFPMTAGAYDTSLDGISDAFVAKLTGAGGSDADFDSDGEVDSDDLGIWETGFGTTTGAHLENGDADGDGDVDGNDFLTWQLNFGNTSPSGSAATSAAGLGANEGGSGAFLGKGSILPNISVDSSSKAIGLVRNSVGNCQGNSMFPSTRKDLSLRSVDFVGWSLPQPMLTTNGNTTAWLDLPQFQSRDASRAFQRDLAVDAVMSGLDDNGSRKDLNRIDYSVQDITRTAFTTVNDELWMANRVSKTSLQEITNRLKVVEDRANLETALEELTIEPLFQSSSFIRV